MGYQNIRCDIENNIATLNLINSAKHNALNSLMIQELTNELNQIKQSSQVKILILKAEGKSFCAGADLDYMKSMANFSFEQNVEDSKKLSAIFESMIDLPVPIIGYAHGNVFGGGIGLLASCDIIFADENTKFCFSEVKLGLAPAVISPICFARIGFHQARRYFLTGEVFSAQEALRINLIHEIVSIEKSSEKMQSLVNALLQGGNQAQKEIKNLLNGLANFYDHEKIQIAQLQNIISRLRISEDAQERMKKFLNKT